MKLGSLFDGSGGFPLAGALCGIEPIWASEIEPYPMRVTEKRFPNMKQLGDVTKINGGEIEPVDIITFGSPCQDLSVAGKQAGIHEGQRSSLFFEAIRIIKEMRNATSDIFPRFAVWENVPGAFSSHQGADFRAVLQALCEVKDGNANVPQPNRGGGGSLPGVSWEMVTALPGVYMTLSIGEFPSVARESTLSQILDLNAPEKYSLSSKAKAGILRRAKKRGKELPDMLRDALLEGLTAEQLKEIEDAVCETEEKERLEMKDGVITMSDNMPLDEMPPYEE